MATRMKAARKPAPRLAGGRKARRRKAKKGPLRADTVHSDMPLWGRPFFFLKTLAVWSFLIRERIGLARDMGGGASNANFTVSGGTKSLSADVNESLERLLR